MYEFLKKDKRNVVVVHCNAGKGRTGTSIACLLMFAGIDFLADLCRPDDERFGGDSVLRLQAVPHGHRSYAAVSTSLHLLLRSTLQEVGGKAGLQDLGQDRDSHHPSHRFGRLPTIHRGSRG